MELMLTPCEGHYIDEYEANQIWIHGKNYHQALIISPKKIISPWEVESFKTLTITDLMPAILLKPEIIILGTGKNQEFIPIELLVGITQEGIGIEVMTTAAACRTYNLLLSEDRQVVAALIL